MKRVLSALFFAAVAALPSFAGESEDFTLAQAAYFDRLYEVGAEQATKFIVNYPRSRKTHYAHFLLGECLLRQGKLRSAQSEYEFLLRDYARSDLAGKAAYRLAECALRENRLQDALSLYRKFLEDFSESKLAHSAALLCGDILFRLGDFREAGAHFQGLAGDLSLYSRGLCLYKLGEFAEAGDVFKKFEAEFPGSALLGGSKLRLGRSLLALGRLEEAVACFSEVPAESAYAPLAQFWTADAYFKGGMWGKAGSAFEDFLRDFPDSHLADSACNMLGKCLFLLGKMEPACNSWEKLSLNFPESRFSRGAQLLAAYCRYKSSDYKSSTELCSALLKGQSGQPISIYCLGLSLFSQERFKEAADSFHKLAALSTSLGERASYLEGMAHFRDASYGRAEDAFTCFLDKYPQSVQTNDAQYLLAESLCAMGKYSESIASYERLIGKSASPLEEEAIYKTGVVLLGMGRSRQALETFQKMVEKYPAGELANSSKLRIGDALFNMGHYKEALPIYEEAGGELARFQTGSCLYREGDFPQAAHHFSLLGAEYPDSALAPGARYWQATALLKSGELYRAREEYQKMLSLHPGSKFISNAFYGIANTYYEGGKYKEAACEYEKLLRSFPDDVLSPDALFLAGLCCRKLGRSGEAGEKFQLYLSSYPEGRQAGIAGLHLGKYLLDGGKTQEARARFLEILEKTTSDILKAHAHYWLGRSYESEGSLKQAKREFKILDPKCLTETLRRDALLRVGSILRAEGKFHEAIRTYEGIVRNFEGETAAYYWIGRSLQELKKWEKAISVFKNAQGHGDEQLRADVQFRIALSHEQMGRLTEAGLGYLKVIYLYPGIGELVLEAESRVAGCFTRQGKFEEAENFYRKIIRADPSGAKGALAREKINALKKQGAKS